MPKNVLELEKDIRSDNFELESVSKSVLNGSLASFAPKFIIKINRYILLIFSVSP